MTQRLANIDSADIEVNLYVFTTILFPSTVYRFDSVTSILRSMCLRISLSLWWTPFFPKLKPIFLRVLSSTTDAKAISIVFCYRSVIKSLTLRAYVTI